MKEKIQKINDYEWLLPKNAREGMKVDAKIIANKKILWTARHALWLWFTNGRSKCI